MRPRITALEFKLITDHRNKEETEGNRVLIIGDLHLPFELDNYFNFCIHQYRKYSCNKIIFIGDIIDNHYASYHEESSDAMGGGDELDLAINKLKKWYKFFPVADVMLGNHDILIMRKAQTSKIPTKWIKNYKDVLETPGWNFVDSIVYDNVFYHHGIGSKAHMKAQKNMMSTVGGHWHTESFVHWYVGKMQKVFGMQVGCGVDDKSFAMAYAKWFPKSAIGCGVVIDGTTAINCMMDL